MAQSRKLGALSTGYPRILPPTPTALHTPADGLVEGEVWVPVEAGELPAYRAMPAGAGPHPILLVVQEIFGVDEYLKDICRRAAHAGYVAIAPELYAREARPGECETLEAVLEIEGLAVRGPGSGSATRRLATISPIWVRRRFKSAGSAKKT